MNEIWTSDLTQGVFAIITITAIVVYWNWDRIYNSLKSAAQPKEKPKVKPKVRLRNIALKTIAELSRTSPYDDAPSEEEINGLEHVFLPNPRSFVEGILKDTNCVIRKVESGLDVWVHPKYCVSNEDVAYMNPDIDLSELFTHWGENTHLRILFPPFLLNPKPTSCIAIAEVHETWDGELRKATDIFSTKRILSTESLRKIAEED